MEVFKESEIGEVSFSEEARVSREPDEPELGVSGEGYGKSRTEFRRRIGGREHTFACTLWRPEGPVKALLYITHGYGSHLWSNFDVIGTYFARRGYLVFGHDNLGHGRTTGERAQLSTTLEEDFALPVVAHCRARKRLDGTNGIPLFILGHSFGSLISLIAAARAPPGLFQGVILCSIPFSLELPNRSPWISSAITWFAGAYAKIRPGAELFEFDENEMGGNAEWNRRYAADELVWKGGVKIKLAMEIGKVAREFASEEHSHFNLPTLIMHGEDDASTSPSGSKKLYELIASKDKTLRLFPGAKHNLFMEVEEIRREAVEEQLKWLEKRRLKDEIKSTEKEEEQEEVNDGKKKEEEEVDCKIKEEEEDEMIQNEIKKMSDLLESGNKAL